MKTIPNPTEYFEVEGRFIAFVGADEHFLGVEDEPDEEMEWCGIHDAPHVPGGLLCCQLRDERLFA